MTNVPLTKPLVMRVAVVCDSGCLAKLLVVYMVQIIGTQHTAQWSYR